MPGSFAAIGTGADTTVFVDAFGQLVRDTDRKDLATSAVQDLYSVFDARARLMGWSTTPTMGSSAHRTGSRSRRVLWWMHEAELSSEAEQSRIGWVQVGLEKGVEVAAALPALIQCFYDALGRFGAVEFSGLQVTVSYLRAGTESTAWDLVSGLNWFTVARDTEAEAVIAFDDGLLEGRSESEFAATLGRMGGGTFELAPPVPVPAQNAIAVPVEAPIDVDLSPARLGVLVRMPEWSASSAAWVLAVVTDTALSGRVTTRGFAVRLTRVQASSRIQQP